MAQLRYFFVFRNFGMITQAFIELPRISVPIKIDV
jgi:hypothetical protein